MRSHVLFVAFVLSVSVAATWSVVAGDVDKESLPSVGIGALTLLVTVITLWNVVPRPARIVLMRQDELGLTDLIFYLGEEDGRPVPWEYLLQLHVALANVGGRKGVVSRATIESLHAKDGGVVMLPDTTVQLSATEYHQRSGYRDGVRYFENASDGGPWLLAPDDVITLRFRTRRGIDWSERWDLAELRRFHDALTKEIVEARGVVVWRQGDRICETPFTVPVQGEQQELFVTSLRALTKEFQERPSVGPIALQPE